MALTEQLSTPKKYTTLQDGVMTWLLGGWQRSYYYQDLPTPLTVRAAYRTRYQTDETARPVFSFTHLTRFGATHYIPEHRPNLLIRKTLRSRLSQLRKRKETAEPQAELTTEAAIDAEVKKIMADAEGERLDIAPPEIRRGYYSLVRQTDNVTRVHGALYRAFHRRQQVPETPDRTRPPLHPRPSPHRRRSS